MSEHPGAQSNASHKPPSSPSSPQEEKFWTTPGEPSRVLRFSDNLLDEEVSLGDISTGSFGSPLSSELKPVKLFGDVLDDDPTVIQHKPSLEDQPAANAELVEGAEDDGEEKKFLGNNGVLSPIVDKAISPKRSPIPPLLSSPSVTNSGESTETPKPGRQRKIRVNIEVERVVVRPNFHQHFQSRSHPYVSQKFYQPLVTLSCLRAARLRLHYQSVKLCQSLSFSIKPAFSDFCLVSLLASI